MHPPKFTSYQIVVMAILVLTQFSVILDLMVMSPLGDMLIKSMKLTPAQFGIIISSYAFSAGISGLLTAGFADRFDRKKLLLFFYIGFIGGTLLCGMATSYYFMVAARIITGIFGGVIGSISLAIVADLFVPEQRGRVMGFVQMGFGSSQVLGIPISLYLANHWGWQSPFFMIVGLALAVWVLAFFKMKPIIEHLAIKNTNNAAAHLWETVKTPKYRIGFLASMFLSLGGFMMMPWGSAYAVNNLLITYEDLPFLFMLAGVSTLVAMPIAGVLSDRMNRFAIFASASAGLAVVILLYTQLSATSFWIVAALNMLMMMGITSRMVPAMALNTLLPAPHDRGAFMSFNSSMQQMSGGIGAVVAGLMVSQANESAPLENYDTLGYAVVMVIVISAVLVFMVSKLVSK